MKSRRDDLENEIGPLSPHNMNDSQFDNQTFEKIVNNQQMYGQR